MAVIVGVDPGQTGAVALVDSYGVLVAVHDMPVVGGAVDPYLLYELEAWRDHEMCFDYGPVVIEDVHSMPKQGVASSFKFGRSKGVVEGVFAGLGLSVRYVTPSKWKTDLRLGKDKGAARQRAIQLWPSHADMFKRVKDDGRAEAALIAWWFWKHGGEQ